MVHMKSPSVAPKRDRYHHGDLRNALLEASLALVAQRGVEAFSLREAARAVGVSPAAAYRHFADKDALLAGLAREAFGRLSHAMERGVARAPGTPGTPEHAIAAFGAVGTAYVEFAIGHPADFRVMFGPWCTGEEEPVVAGPPGGRQPYAILVDTLDALVAAGVVPREARAGAEIAAWSTVHGLASLVVEGAVTLTKPQRAQALRLLLQTLLRGLGCDAALLGPPPEPVDADPCAREDRAGASKG
jgi:AcrR family transcriptional regulator